MAPDEGDNLELKAGKYLPLSEAERIQLFCAYSSPSSTTEDGNSSAHGHIMAELNKELRAIRDSRNSPVKFFFIYFMALLFKCLFRAARVRRPRWTN